MPSYRYRCLNGHELERFCSIDAMEAFESTAPACTCGEALARDYSIQKPIAFHEGVYEHVGPDPVYISSAQQLNDVCERNGLYSRYAEDMGSLFGRKRNRWV